MESFKGRSLGHRRREDDPRGYYYDDEGCQLDDGSNGYYDTEEFDEWHLQHLLALARRPFCPITKKFIHPPSSSPTSSTTCRGGDPDPRPLMMAAVPPPTAHPALAAAFAAGPLLPHSNKHQVSQLKPRLQPTQPQTQQEVLSSSFRRRSHHDSRREQEATDEPLHSSAESPTWAGAGAGTGTGTLAEDRGAAPFIHLEEMEKDTAITEDDVDDESMSEQHDEVKDITPSTDTPSPGGCGSASAGETGSMTMIALPQAGDPCVAGENRICSRSMFIAPAQSSSSNNKLMICRNCGTEVTFQHTQSLLCHVVTAPCVIRRIGRTLGVVRGCGGGRGDGDVDVDSATLATLETLSRSREVAHAVRELWCRHFVVYEAPEEESDGGAGRRPRRRQRLWSCRHCSRTQSQGDISRLSRHLVSCLGITAVIRALEESLLPFVSAALMGDGVKKAPSREAPA